MKSTMLRASWGLWLGVSVCLIQTLDAQTAPKLSIHVYPGYAGITVTGTVNAAYAIQATTNLLETNGWVTIDNVVLPPRPYVYSDYASPGMAKRFYRAVGTNRPPINMVLIPAGSFTMGDTFNDSDSSWGERPTHTVHVSAFYMDRYEVTKALYDEVYTWAIQHGYNFDYAGSGKASNDPVWAVNWYEAVKWCNARSEKANRIPAYYTYAAQTTVYRTGHVNVQNAWVKWNAGYRLPTEAEWEYAARGGLEGKRFPWGDTITHSQANYYSVTNCAYDVSSTRGYHPSYYTWDTSPSHGIPYTSPVGSFAPNGYGLYDMAGNVNKWCWDWYGSYTSGSQTDPRGPTSGSSRVLRSGNWSSSAILCRVAFRYYNGPDAGWIYYGFRTVLPPGQ